MPLRLRISFAVFLWLLLLAVGMRVSPAGSGTLTPGKFYVVGTGPAGPEHATQRALEVIKGADYILCDEDMKKRFPVELQGKPVIADTWKAMWEYKGKPAGELKGEEKRAYRQERVKIREDIIRQIKEKMAQEKVVALLDSGDPCLFGPSHWFIEGFEPEQVEIVPGVGAFTAAMAALKKSSLPAHEAQFLLQTSSMFLGKKQEEAEEVLKDLAKHPATMVFYMSTRKLDNFVAMLRNFYPGDLPIAVVYHAGYSDKEKVFQGKLDNILAKITGKKEEWMGLIIVGRCLEGKPWRSAVERITGDDD